MVEILFLSHKSVKIIFSNLNWLFFDAFLDSFLFINTSNQLFYIVIVKLNSVFYFSIRQRVFSGKFLQIWCFELIFRTWQSLITQDLIHLLKKIVWIQIISKASIKLLHANIEFVNVKESFALLSVEKHLFKTSLQSFSPIEILNWLLHSN